MVNSRDNLEAQPNKCSLGIRHGGGVSLTSGVYVEHENPALDILRHGHR